VNRRYVKTTQIQQQKPTSIHNFKTIKTAILLQAPTLMMRDLRTRNDKF